MKRILPLLALCLLSFSMHAQEDAWIFLTDKDNVQGALNNPISILTQDAIDRKNAHNVTIDERDVPVNEVYISELKDAAGITVMAKSKWMNAVHVRGSEADINNLTSLSFVDAIEWANKNLNIRETVPFNKFEVPETSRVDFNYGDSANQIEMINGHELHMSDYTGDGITVAVIDAGFPNVNTMGAFQRLRDAGKLMDGYDFVLRTENIYDYTGNSHGTRVLSDMAGYIENQFVGTAPDATYYIFRSEDAATENPVEESYWVEAAERADSLGVDVINTSLGYKGYDNPNYSHSDADINGLTTFITRGATIAFEKGMLLVTSAGNSGANGLGAPADSPGVLAIGAVDANGNYASFSSQGSAIQQTHKPDVAAQGASPFVIDQNNNIVNNNGTSFSSPIMAGGIASLWQAVPSLTNAELMQIVRESASQYTTPDYFLGYGIPDLQQALAVALSIVEFENPSTEIKLFPNPAQDEITISYPFQDDEVITLNVFNVLGKLVNSVVLNSQKNKVNIASLSSGIYLTRLDTQAGSMTYKLIKE